MKNRKKYEVKKGGSRVVSDNKSAANKKLKVEKPNVSA